MNKADGSIRDVQVFGAPSEDTLANADVILSWGALIAGVDPTLTAEQRGQILRDLGLVDGDEWIEPGYESRVIENGVGALSFNAGDPTNTG